MEKVFIIRHNPQYGDGWEIWDDYVFKTSDDAIEYIKDASKIYFYENLEFNIMGNEIHVTTGIKWHRLTFIIEEIRIFNGQTN